MLLFSHFVCVLCLLIVSFFPPLFIHFFPRLLFFLLRTFYRPSCFGSVHMQTVLCLCLPSEFLLAKWSLVKKSFQLNDVCRLGILLCQEAGTTACVALSEEVKSRFLIRHVKGQLRGPAEIDCVVLHPPASSRWAEVSRQE